MEGTQGLPLEVRLSAYLDGQLTQSEVREIDGILARDEKARTLFNRLKLGSDLGRQAFEDMLHEPVPLDLVRSIKQASIELGHERGPAMKVLPPKEAPARDDRARLAAAGLALLLAGTGAGYLLGIWKPPLAAPTAQAEAARNWLDDVADYHSLYASQSRHLVEVPASESPHITQWLTKVVGVDFTIPDLSDSGLSFEGARLLLAGGRPTGQLVYRDAEGQVFAVCFQKADPGSARTEPAGTIRNGLNLVSWQDRNASFVFVGPSSEPELDALAAMVAQTI